MSDELFEKIIEDCRQFPLPAIEPFLNGEPFMDKKLIRRLEHIRRRLPETKLRLYTNGYLMGPEKIEQMAGLGIDHLFISLNTLNPDEYKKTVGLEIERTLDNIASLSRASSQRRIANNVTFRMTRYPDTTLAEQDKFIEFCKRHGARPMISGLFNYKGDVFSDLPAPKFACDHITRLDVLADGRTTLCCMDHEGEYGWGDIREQSVLAVYNGHIAKRYRNMHLTGRRSAIQPCDTCNVFSRQYRGATLARQMIFKAQADIYFAKYHPRGRKAPRAMGPQTKNSADTP
jgi:molybdenum cofactor biosynthesis enzyme MoaA